MTRSLSALALILATLVLTACARPDTPQEVTEHFWRAVIAGDAEAAAELSTLVNEGAYDAFERDWQAATVTYGRVVIEGDQASVHVTIQGLPQGPDSGVDAITHLVRTDGLWQVDYYRTADTLAAGAGLERFVGKLEALGRDLSERFSQQSDQASRDMAEITAELERLADTANQRLQILVDEYGEVLDRALKDLSRSLEEALEQHPEATPEDKRTLNQAVLRLDRQRDELQDPDLQAVAQGSQIMAETRVALASLGETFAEEKRQWQEILAEWQARSQALLTELSAPQE